MDKRPYNIRSHSPEGVRNARKLREGMTDGEKLLWRRLRQSQTGFKFRRQHPVGPYVLDFYCAEAQLCIEVDGEFHAARSGSDKARDLWLDQNGVETLRIPSWDVFEYTDSVVTRITDRCIERAGRSPK